MGDKAIRVREDVHRQVRELAAAEGITAGEVVEMAVAEWRKLRRRTYARNANIRRPLSVTFHRGSQLSRKS